MNSNSFITNSNNLFYKYDFYANMIMTILTICQLCNYFNALAQHSLTIRLNLKNKSKRMTQSDQTRFCSNLAFSLFGASMVLINSFSSPQDSR